MHNSVVCMVNVVKNAKCENSPESMSQVLARIEQMDPGKGFLYSNLKDMFLFGNQEGHDGILNFLVIDFNNNELGLIRRVFKDIDKLDRVSVEIHKRKELRGKVKKFGKLELLERVKVISSIFVRSVIDDGQVGSTTSILTSALSELLREEVVIKNMLVSELIVAAIGYKCLVV